MLMGSREEAAQRLGISVYTIREHTRNTRNLCFKLDARSSRDAAFRVGWVHIPPEYLTGADPVPESSSQPSAPVVTRVG